MKELDEEELLDIEGGENGYHIYQLIKDAKFITDSEINRVKKIRKNDRQSSRRVREKTIYKRDYVYAKNLSTKILDFKTVQFDNMVYVKYKNEYRICK